MRVCEQNDPAAFPIGEQHSARCWLHHETAPARIAELYYPESGA